MISNLIEASRNIFNIQWLIGSILYDVLKYTFFVVLIGGIIGLYKVISISLILLKDNPDTQKEMGKHFADRFIEIWYSFQPIHYYKNGGIYSPQLLVAELDEELKKMGLVHIDLDEIYGSYISPKRTCKNRIILLIVKIYLLWWPTLIRRFFTAISGPLNIVIRPFRR